MSSERQGNGKFDGLLKAGLPATLQPASADCLDAEMLAAWSEGALSRTETDRVESHLAGCARCQAMLATFVHAEPEAATVVPFWRRRQIRWLVPIAAGMAALTIWMVVPGEDEIAPTNTIARVEPTAPTAGEATPAAPPPAREEQAAVPHAKVLGAESRAGAAPLAKAEGVPSEPQPQAAADASRDTRTRTEKDAVPPPLPAAAAPPAREDLPGTAPLAQQSARGIGRNGQSAQKATDTLARNVIEPIVIEVTPPPSSIDRVSEVSDAAAVRGGRRNPAVAAAPPPPPPPSAPPARVRWRIVDGNRVERARSETAPWEPLTIDPPVTLSGGFAPSSSVCWLIGPNGVILRATNGVNFARVSFPEVTDLRSILATNSLQATVTAADGRVFVTANGGTSWTTSR